MQATIKKWGNSPALRLSTSLMQLAHLSLDQEVSIRVLKGKIVIEPISPKEYSLESLVGGITPQNCHAESDYGSSVGMEVF
jgi:antitoxin MazE